MPGLVPLSERAQRRAFYLACAGLAGWMVWAATHPWKAFLVDRINKDMGLWSLRFLFACLLISPVSRLFKWPGLRRWRRPLGLAAFAFATLHTVHFLLWGRIWPDRLDVLLIRPYLTIGTVALILFIPLAVTSNDAMVRKVTPKRWRRLHLLVYPVAALSVVHEVMAYGPIKGEAGLYSLLAIVLTGLRLTLRRGKVKPPSRPVRPLEAADAT